MDGHGAFRTCQRKGPGHLGPGPTYFGRRRLRPLVGSEGGFGCVGRTEMVGLRERCGLVVAWNDPRRDNRPKRAVQRELSLLPVRASSRGVIAFFETIGYTVDGVIRPGERLEGAAPADEGPAAGRLTARVAEGGRRPRA